MIHSMLNKVLTSCGYHIINTAVLNEYIYKNTTIEKTRDLNNEPVEYRFIEWKVKETQTEICIQRDIFDYKTRALVKSALNIIDKSSIRGLCAEVFTYDKDNLLCTLRVESGECTNKYSVYSISQGYRTDWKV